MRHRGRQTVVMRRLATSIVLVVAGAAVLAGCASSGNDEQSAGSATTDASTTDASTIGTAATPAGDGLYPDVVDATVERNGDTFTFDVTISSPYDTPDRYADAWRVVGPDGTVLGVRELLHDHQNEQPFTRSLSGVEIPDDVDTVTIEGRDQVNGWGGATVEVELP